jgi:MYXO-CTERM domain-containing protein
VYNNPSFGTVYHTSSLAGSDGRVAFFNEGVVIGGGGNGNTGFAWLQENNNPSLDFTSDQLNKNIGFKTSTGNWGWANVSWTEASKTLAINYAFVESVPGNSITITPEPSRALLALAGLGGVALRRRRKQAA